MSAWRYYRFMFTDDGRTGASEGSIRVPEVELRLTAGGADVTGPGLQLYSASSVYSTSTADKAFDNNSGTVYMWRSDEATSVPQWLLIDFETSPAELGEYTIEAHTWSTEEHPTAWQLQVSNDGLIWLTIDEQSGITWAGAGEVKTFTLLPVALVVVNGKAPVVQTDQIAFVDLESVEATAQLPVVLSSLEVFPGTVSVLVEADRPWIVVAAPSSVESVNVTAHAPLIEGRVVAPPAQVEVSTHVPTIITSTQFSSAYVTALGKAAIAGVAVAVPSASVTVTAAGLLVGVQSPLPVASVVAQVLDCTVGAAAPIETASVSVQSSAPICGVVAVPMRALVYARGLPFISSLETGANTVVVLNANTLAVSEYAVSALDVIAYDGGLYFVQEAELIKAAASVSAVDFAAVVETGMLSLGVDGKKYIPRVNATLSGDSITEVWMTIELDGDSIEIGPYELPGRSGSASFVRKWKFAGGVKADSASLRFEGTDGTAWKLQGLTLDTEPV